MQLLMPAQILLGASLIFDSLLRFGLLCLRLLLKRSVAVPTLSSAEFGVCHILIPAHNEAGTIGATVTALVAQLEAWPGAQIWVLADRCTDRTATEAANAGAKVVARATGPYGKGAVLAWWLESQALHWSERDCVLVLDADSRLAEGSLRVLRTSMQSDVVAAQAFVAPAASSKAGRLAGWSEVLMQRIDDEARLRCGWNVPLRGTGMVFRVNALAELAPRLHTLAEDLELDVLLAAQQSKVFFVPQAVVFDPKPQQTAGASRQRARWLQGQMQVLRDYWPQVLQALVKGGSGAWFLLWLLFLRPKIALMGLRVLLLSIGLLLGAGGIWLTALALVGLSLDALYYLGGIAIVDDRARYIRDMMSTPRYIAMWVYSIGLATVRRGWLKAGR